MQDAYALQYASYEQEHWWFKARRAILQDRIRALHLPPKANILEIGVGPGENLYSLYPEDAQLTGIEPDPMLLKTAQARGSVPIYEAYAEELPAELLDNSFDAITMFDILEHTKDDSLVLERVKQKLKPGGLLVMSVPALMLLWGQQDVVNLHYRRYTRKNLVDTVRKAGFKMERATYFNSILFPPIAAVRIANRMFSAPTDSSKSDFSYSLGIVDEVLYSIFHSEKWLLRAMDLPIGVSLFCVAKKVA